MIALVRLLCLATLAFPIAAQSTPEARTSRAYDAAKAAGAPELYAFLRPMPKGADLHMHLSGAVYAETFLREAVAQSLCIDTAALALRPAAAPCPAGQVPASDILKNQHLYDALIDAFSMRGFVPTPGITGHDQFFATFERFGAAKNPGEWLNEVASRAAAQNEQYLEIMQTPPFSNAAAAGYKLGWPEALTDANYKEKLSTLRDQLLASGLRSDLPLDTQSLADSKSRERADAHCDTVPSPACAVTIHWLYQVLRAFPPQQVFAQTLLGFELASTNPDVVGINFVQPEDHRTAMADYHLHMLMLDYLHTVYPAVRISLHAGELAPGLVPPAGLSFHIREAVDLGHASRIGHGVDVLYENRPAELLHQLATQHVMIEMNLTSNDGILNIKGKDHPFAAYRAAHVPVALSTDDEGVSRSDLTHEYVRAAFEQNFTYADAKRSARTSLEHAFLAGPSLWPASDDFTHRTAACAAPITPTSHPTPACTAFLVTSERATMQYELEHRFAIFEAGNRE